MTSEFIRTLEELEATTPQALIDTRKYIGGWLYYNVTRRYFHAVVNKMERLNYRGSTVQAMKFARDMTVKNLKNLNAPKRAINAYINDIERATKGAILDK